MLQRGVCEIARKGVRERKFASDFSQCEKRVACCLYRPPTSAIASMLSSKAGVALLFLVLSHRFSFSWVGEVVRASDCAGRVGQSLLGEATVVRPLLLWWPAWWQNSRTGSHVAIVELEPVLPIKVHEAAVPYKLGWGEVVGILSLPGSMCRESSHGQLTTLQVETPSYLFQCSRCQGNGISWVVVATGDK